MGTDVETTPEDVEIALHGIRMQAEAHGLDVEDASLAKFLRHTAEVKASSIAMERFLDSVIAEMRARNDDDVQKDLRSTKSELRKTKKELEKQSARLRFVGWS